MNELIDKILFLIIFIYFTFTFIILIRFEGLPNWI